MNNKVKAALLTMLSATCGSTIDSLAKFLSDKLPTAEIIAGRNFGACLILLLLYIFYPKCRKDFKTKRLGVHFFRGLVICVSIYFWVSGLKTTMLATTTIIGFAANLIFIAMSWLFLKEKVSSKTWICASICFCSLFFVVDISELSWNSGTVLLLAGSSLFALTHILNKKYTGDETNIAITFYGALFSGIIALCATYDNFVIPSLSDLGIFLGLGAGASLMLWLLLKAFAMVDANFIAPFKFFEFISALTMGFVFFGEIPAVNNFIAIILILVANLYMLFSDKKK